MGKQAGLEVWRPGHGRGKTLRLGLMERSVLRKALWFLISGVSGKPEQGMKEGVGRFMDR